MNWSICFLFLAGRSGTQCDLLLLVAHLLHDLSCCAFRDALLQTLAVMSYNEGMLPLYKLKVVQPLSSDLWLQRTCLLLGSFSLLDYSL